MGVVSMNASSIYTIYHVFARVVIIKVDKRGTQREIHWSQATRLHSYVTLHIFNASTGHSQMDLE